MRTAVRAVLEALFRVLFTYDCLDEEKIPPEGPAVIASNHPSYLDPVRLSLQVERPIRFMAWDALVRQRTPQLAQGKLKRRLLRPDDRARKVMPLRVVIAHREQDPQVLVGMQREILHGAFLVGVGNHSDQEFGE